MAHGQCCMVLVRKSVKQTYQPSRRVLWLMENFRQMTNDCIRIGLRENASTLKRLSILAYDELRRRYYGTPSYYKLCAISKAAGILSARKKPVRRGYLTKDPYVSKPVLVSCYGFKVENDHLIVPVGDGLSPSLSTPTPSRYCRRTLRSKFVPSR